MPTEIPAQRPVATPKVIIADPDPLTRAAVKEMLRAERGFTVVAEARDGVEAVELSTHYEPDLLVTELALDRWDGLEVTRRVGSGSPRTRVVLFTTRHDDEAALEALRAGAAAVLTKESSPEEVRAALLGVHDGHTIVPPQVVTLLVDHLRSAPSPGRGFRPINSSLTNREWEVIDRMAAGESTREMAEALVLTEDTIYSHVKNLMRKLGARSRAEAIERAQELCRLPVAA